MTNEEAIVILENICCNPLRRIAVDLAIKALEKQIAIKPKDIATNLDGVKTGRCKCKHFMTMIDWNCNKCGQRLDWSDTE